MSIEKKEKNENKKGLNPIIYRVLFFVFLAMFLISSGLMLKEWLDDRAAQKQYEDLGKLTETQDTDESQSGSNTTDTTEPGDSQKPQVNELEALGITVPEKNPDWDAIWEINKDVVAWIYIPGTKVDYPILCHQTKDSFYLSHGLDGKKSAAGGIYIHRSVTNGGFLENTTTVYGHNARNKTMFGSLHNYENAMFFDEYRYIYVYTPDATLVYDIVAAYETDDTNVYYGFGTYDESGYQDYIDYVMSEKDLTCNIREGVTVTTKQKMLVLSTCMDNITGSSRRYKVNAVLVNPSALE